MNNGKEVLGLGDGSDEGEGEPASRASSSYGGSSLGDSSSSGGYDQPPRRHARFKGARPRPTSSPAPPGGDKGVVPSTRRALPSAHRSPLAPSSLSPPLPLLQIPFSLTRRCRRRASLDHAATGTPERRGFVYEVRRRMLRPPRPMDEPGVVCIASIDPIPNHRPSPCLAGSPRRKLPDLGKLVHGLPRMVDPWSQMPLPTDATTWRPPTTRSS
nr:uncharacterized protein LOC109756248 [Aegilops tauschii subsp. strangulata]